MIGIMLIDMQERYFIKEKEELVSAQIRLLDYAKEKSIPVFTLEYVGEGETIPELKRELEGAKNYFVKKYNNNSFIKLNDNYLKGKFNDWVLFGDEWNENPPENKRLISLLKKNKIKKLILTGINKSECVFKTAKGAKKRGYEIFTSDELMNEQKTDYLWYSENSNHHRTLDKLIENIETKAF
jgi:nicotinamidase-related amidase